MLVHGDTFALLSELAIAVAGFAGVAVALGGRARTFGPFELLRLNALFQYSALILGGCFGLFVLNAAGLGSADAIRLVSIAGAFGYGAIGIRTVPRAFRLLAASDGSASSPARVYLVAGTYLVFIALFLVNGLVLADEWPLLIVFSSSLLMALWIFHGLLTLRG